MIQKFKDSKIGFGKKLFLGLFIFLSSIPFVRAQEFPANQTLKKMLDNGDYFHFRYQLELEYEKTLNRPSPMTPEFLYFFSWSDFLFNKPESSNQHIENLLANKSFTCPDSITAELLSLHFQNDLRLFHYKTADSICSILLFQYPTVMDKDVLEGVKNSEKVVAGLKDIPPQTIERNGDMDVKFKRDIASLIRIPVTMNGKSAHFVMDTGANLSTISESEAKKMGVKILDASFGVTSSSRSSVDSKLGVADKIQIGNITFRNVVFIVLPDKSLSFIGGLYKIKGIIGLPVIAQLGEVQIKKNGHIFSPSKQTESKQPESYLENFGMEGNTPFINVAFYGEYHPYIFDTGAATGIYGGKFKTTYADSLKDAPTKKSQVGGAGGIQTISILSVTNLHYEIGNAKKVLKRSTVQLSGNETIFDTFYGIVGEDIFSQWDLVTINFDKMFVLME
jgi:predicted aspartyl protease